MRGLHGEDRFLAVFVFGKENVAEILKIAIARLGHDIGVFHHLLHIFRLDEAETIALLVAVAPGDCEIALCEISGSCHLVGSASAVGDLHGKSLVGKLKLIDDLPEQLLIRKLVVAHLLMGAVFKHGLVDPGNRRNIVRSLK